MTFVVASCGARRPCRRPGRVGVVPVSVQLAMVRTTRSRTFEDRARRDPERVRGGDVLPAASYQVVVVMSSPGRVDWPATSLAITVVARPRASYAVVVTMPAGSVTETWLPARS